MVTNSAEVSGSETKQIVFAMNGDSWRIGETGDMVLIKAE